MQSMRPHGVGDRSTTPLSRPCVVAAPAPASLRLRARSQRVCLRCAGHEGRSEPQAAAAGAAAAAAPCAPLDGSPRSRGRLQELISRYGMGAAFSFITFSNACSLLCLSAAWLAFWSRFGCSPLQQGQWPKFLGFYSLLYAAQQASRPLRLAAGLALTPIGDALIASTARVLHCSRHVALLLLFGLQAAAMLTVLGAVALVTGRPPS